MAYQESFQKITKVELWFLKNRLISINLLDYISYILESFLKNLYIN